MSSPDIPDVVFQFITEKIDTVPQLEALLLLWENPNRAWPQEEVAARIYVSPDAASSILQALQRRQLVTLERAEPPQYRYSTVWDAEGEVMRQVARAYRTHLVRVATFIHSRASSSVREFARAFELKRDR